MRSKEELLRLMADYVRDMEDEAIVDIAKEYLDAGYPAKEGILDGLTVGMEEAGKLYDEEEYYIAELLLCADAMYAGIDVLKGEIEGNTDKKIKAVIGVIDGEEKISIGHTDYGLTIPGEHSAITIAQLTWLLLTVYPSGDSVVAADMINKWVDVVREQYFKTHDYIFPNEPKLWDNEKN